VDRLLFLRSRHATKPAFVHTEHTMPRQPVQPLLLVNLPLYAVQTCISAWACPILIRAVFIPASAWRETATAESNQGRHVTTDDTSSILCPAGSTIRYKGQSPIVRLVADVTRDVSIFGHQGQIRVAIRQPKGQGSLVMGCSIG
jgi:hypothetical protein